MPTEEWGVNADPNPEPGTFLVEWQSGAGKLPLLVSPCVPLPWLGILCSRMSQKR